MINLPPESEEEQEDSFLSERLIDLYIKHWHRGSVGVRGGPWGSSEHLKFGYTGLLFNTGQDKEKPPDFSLISGSRRWSEGRGCDSHFIIQLSAHEVWGGDTTVSIQTNQRPVYKWTQLSGFCFSYKEWANHNINKPGYYDHIEPMKVLTKKRQIF